MTPASTLFLRLNALRLACTSGWRLALILCIASLAFAPSPGMAAHASAVEQSSSGRAVDASVPPQTVGTDPNAALWPLWTAYAARFVDPNGRVIDHDAADRTTSEGQSYAMFFAVVANDPQRFELLLRWTSANLAQNDLTAHLPAWEWGHAADGSWRILDANSASDADLWMSYSLIQAGALWKEPRYRSLGLALAALIAASEVKDVPGLGPMLLPGNHGFNGKDSWLLNPSYSPLPVLTGMAHASPAGPWKAIARSLPGFLQRSAVDRFAMDWVTYSLDGNFAPALLPTAAKQSKPAGSYDAIRVYLWAGLAPPQMPDSARVLHAVSGMSGYLAAHPVPPNSVDSAGVATGDGSVGFSAALLPYLSALGAASSVAEQMNRLQALRNPATGLYGPAPHYYDQNLTLFAEGWLDRRYCFSAAGELRVAWNGNCSSEHSSGSGHDAPAVRKPAQQGRSRE